MRISFGEMLRKRREELGLTRDGLAEKCGSSSPTIYRWERDERKPRSDDLKKLASALGVSVAYLMGEDEAVWGPMRGDFEVKYGMPKRPRTDLIQVAVLSPENTACCGSGLPVIDSGWDGDVIYVARSDIGANFDDMRQPFVIEAEGDSMMEWGIPSGCRVLVNPAEEVRNMDIALICYYDKLAFKKVKFLRTGGVDLMSSDGKFVHVPKEDNIPELFQIWGKAMIKISKIEHGV